MKYRSWGWVMGASLALGASLASSDASACGGFFCSQAQGVNQSAERIVFAQNDDGTVTAVIEIMYQGPADKFSWLLPISSVPERVQVGSSLSLQRLQQATNPQYSLSTSVEGTCDAPPNNGAGGTASGFPAGGAGDGAVEAGGAPSGDGVTVEASGFVGAFEWAVISLDASLPSAATSAVTWLNDNGYDVPEGAPALLGPYLQDGLYLLALKLQKNADAGSIRPIVLTYEATKPMIPIKLTAVAANDDMGVLTWVLGQGQAVPKNYYALELNEARINWFNPNPTYNAVVIQAADEASGQGFVTEYAQEGRALQGQIWAAREENSWLAYEAEAPSWTADQRVTEAAFAFSQWDGFWDVVRRHVQLPPEVALSDVQSCVDCYRGYVPDEDFASALESDVIEPARVVQQLLDSHPQVTRLYTTMSAAEMTVDPLFTFNADLPPVSNVHNARRIIECAPGYYVSQAPWRIELPQGGVVRGGPDTLGQWPTEFDELPANFKILRRGEKGSGQVVEDNGVDIDQVVTAYNDSLPTPPKRPGVSSEGGNGNGDTSEGGDGNGNGNGNGNGGDSNDSGSGSSGWVATPAGGCACHVSPRSSAPELALGLGGALLALGRGLRRRAIRRQRSRA